MSAEIKLTDDTFEKEVLQSPDPVLVDFWAPWCGPCRMLAPVVEELAEEYSGKAKIAKLNTDESPNTATKYNISAIPTMLFFKGGQVEKQIVGVQSKSNIKKILDELVGSNA